MLNNDWKKWLLSLTPAARRDRRKPGMSRPPRLALERLEDRLAPAVHDLTSGNSFPTIQAAVTAATAGDTLLADPGTYAESVTVNKSLTIEGNQHGVDARNRSGAESVVTGAGNNGATPFNITASNVTIDGFTVQGATNANQFGFGILVGAGTSGTHVLNNIVQNNIAGLSLANNSTSNQTVIQHNLFQNNNQSGPASGAGIYTDQFNAGGTLSDVLIDSNTFRGNTGDAGIDFSSTAATKPATCITVSNNLFDGNARGLAAFNLTSSAISANTFTNSTGAQTADLRLLEGDSGLTITGNFLQNGAGRAVRVSNSGTGSPDPSNIRFFLNSINGYTGPADAVAVDNYNGTLDASGNWWGGAASLYTDPTTATAVNRISGLTSGKVSVGSFLDSGANAAAVGFTPAAATEMWVPRTATSTTPFAMPARVAGVIQGGVATAAAGTTVRVAADTYAENVTVNKPLTLLGANAGVNPNTGTRGAETVVVPAVNDPNAGTVFAVTASNVTLDGLTIDGHNPGLSGGVSLNGVSVNAANGVSNANTNINHLAVRNNVIRNLNANGVLGDLTAVGGVTSGDNVIANNKIDNLPSLTTVGRGVLVVNNFYAAITGNVLTRVRTGIQTNNFFLADPGAPALIDGNTVDEYVRGIFHNLQYQSASPWTISNNTVTADAAAVTGNVGLQVISIQSAVSVTLLNNNVSGATYGVELWNLPTTSTVTVQGGTLTGNTDGVLLTNNDPVFGAGAASTANLRGVTVTGSAGAGVLVQDANAAGGAVQLNLGGGDAVAVSAAAPGLVIDGARASAGAGLADTAFTGAAGQFVVLTNAAQAGQTIDATAATFNGSTAAAVPLVQAFAIADRVTDRVDVGTVGFVRLAAGQVFVTPNSFRPPQTIAPDVQRAVDAASAGDTVFIQAGTYANNLLVSKSLTLQGAGIGSTVLNAGSGTGLTLNGPASTVTVQGLSLTGTGAYTPVSASGLANLTLAGVEATGGTGSSSVSNVTNFTYTTGSGATPDAITLTATQLQHTRGAVVQRPYNYSGAQSLTVNGGGAGNTVLVQGTAAGTSTQLNTGAGNDTVYVSSAVGSGNLNGLRGPLAIDAGGGSNVLTVNDAGGGPDTVTLTANSITDTAVHYFIGYRASGGTFAGVNLQTGPGAYRVNVAGTAANASIGVINLGGDDTIAVNPNAGGMNGLAGPVAVLGEGGSDSVTLTTLAGAASTLALSPGQGALTGPGYFVTLRGVAWVSAFGGARDSASFTAAGGPDSFLGTPTYAYLTGAGFTGVASGFGPYRADSPGGGDSAYLYDSAGNAVFVGTPTYASLAGAGFTDVVAGFPTVVASAGAAGDSAYLYGSPAGGNLFLSTPSYGYLSGPGYFAEAVGFPTVTATAGGANDNAYLYGSAGNVMVAASANAYLSGPGYFNDAAGFHSVSGYSGGGGAASLLGTGTSADTFVDRGGYAYLYGDAFLELASGFASVTANPDARR
jgi:hypothetical protein